uniref:Uncharacterized protein n=1 Tax=Anguilla anguilla TaxID=7936 RepID=A0A0E9V9S7_ANGAN
MHADLGYIVVYYSGVISIISEQ